MVRKLRTIQKHFEKLREKCESLVKQVIGDWCKENSVIFSYGVSANYRIIVEKNEIDDDCCLIDSPHIDCFYDSVYGNWYYDVEPALEVVVVLGAYEEMFGYWYQSDCKNGVWSGL